MQLVQTPPGDTPETEAAKPRQHSSASMAAAFVPEIKPKESLDWKDVAPKSLLLVAVFVCWGLACGLAVELKNYWLQDRAEDRKHAENAAIAINGLNLRMSTVENETKTIPELKRSVDKLEVTAARLSGQVELLAQRLPLK